MSKPEREPAEVFCLAEYLCDEMQARGWTTTEVALRMGDNRTPHEFSVNLLSIDLIMAVHKDSLLMNDRLFDGLARAFDVDPQLFRNLDAVWRRWPDRRAPFEAPESIYGPISRRMLMHVVK